jgi:hypothetical protein
MYSDNWRRAAIQLTVWVVVWASILFLLSGSELTVRFTRRLFPILFGVALIAGVNTGILLPKLYFRRRVAYYGLASLLLLIVVTLGIQHGWRPERGFPDVFERGRAARGMALTTLRFLLPFVTTLLGSSLWEVMRYANEQQRRAARARSEQLVTELKFLRSQINPHFLFNTLNNIYTLSLTGDRRAPDSLLQLSGMLRYVLYESETATVPLGREIAYIRNYVELQQLKDSQLSGLSVELDESRPELAIAPLLLVPLVENAFKHGNLGEEEGAFIRIKLTTAPHRIEFAVSNTYSPAPTPKDHTGGIGLANLRKRLTLLYPQDHELIVIDAAATFTATLCLHLSQADGLPDR